MVCSACGYQNRDKDRFCTQCGTRFNMPQKRRGHLVVVSEPDIPFESQNRAEGSDVSVEQMTAVEIATQSFLIGREDDNAFIIKDDQTSAYHAKITSDGQQFWLEDLGSTNGTYVDGIRIHGLTSLCTGSLVKIGATIIKFEYI